MGILEAIDVKFKLIKKSNKQCHLVVENRFFILIILM